MNSFRNLTQYAECHLVSNNTGTTLYQWFTDWMCCDGVDAIRAVLKAKNATSANFSWQLAIQYAPVRSDNPDAPAAIGNGQTGSGEYQTGDLSLAAQADAPTHRLFRLGIAYTSVNASVQQADVSLQASYKSVATPLGMARATLAITDSSNKYEVLTPWIPAIYMAKVKAAFVLNSINPSNGNFKYRLAYQTAGTTVTQPSAWTDIESGWTQPGNGVTYSERNTGEVTVTTSEMWFRLGVAYTQAGGVDTNYTAVLEAVLSCRA